MTGYGVGTYADTPYAGGSSGPPTSGTFADFSGTFADFSGTLVGTYAAPAAISGTLGGSFADYSGALAGNVFDPGLGGFLAGAFSDFSGALYAAKQTSLGGIVLTDLTTADVEPPVETLAAVVQHIVTPTVPVPTLVGGRPQ